MTDMFLIATALFMLGLAMNELFIWDVALPLWLVVKDLQDLQSKLRSVIIMVPAVTFLINIQCPAPARVSLVHARALLCGKSSYRTLLNILAEVACI